MTWLTRITIGKRVLLGFSIMILCIGSLGYTQYRNLQKVYWDLREIYEIRLPSMNYILQADRDLYQALVAERSLLAATSPEELREFRNFHRENLQQSEERWQAFTALPISPEGQSLFPLYEEARNAWKQKTEEVVAAINGGNRNVAAELSFGDAKMRFDAMRSYPDQLTNITLDIAASASQNASETYYTTRLVLIIFTIGGLLTGILITLLISRSITVPLNQLVNFANALAGGDFQQEISIQRGDEIGILAHALDDMKYAIGNVLNETYLITQAIQNGQLDVRGDSGSSSGAWRDLVTGINNVVDAFMTPFNVTAEYLDRISKGDLPPKIIDDYQGDFREVTNNVNLCIDAISGVVAETGNLTDAAVEGTLDVRGDSTQFGGEYRAIIAGINNTIDTLVGHIDQIPAPVMIIDPDYTIRYLNAAGAAMIGQSKTQVAGQKCYEHFKTSDCRAATCASRRAMHSGVPESGDTDAHPNGQDLLITYTSIPRKNPTGAMIGALEIIQDQTEVKNAMNAVQEQNWMRTGQAELSNLMRGDQEPVALSKSVITYLAKYLDVQTGAMYLLHNQNGDPVLQLSGSYAYTWRKGLNNAFHLGEGFVGQAALEQESIGYTDIPDDYLSVGSGLGGTKPQYVLVTPFMYEGDLKGVIEVGSIEKLTDTQVEFLNQAAETIAVAFHSAQTRQRMQDLLEQSQRQAEELQVQQEELQTQRDYEQQHA